MLRSRCTSILAAVLALSAVAAITAAPALASGKPFVETKPATKIGATEATFNGVVNPNGAETKYYFEFGKTTSYGSKTKEVAAGAGTSNLEESVAVEGRTKDSEYHFRIVATNANGTSDGADQVVTLKQKLPEFSNSLRPEETGVGQATFTLAGKVATWKFQTEDFSCKRSKGTGLITGAKSGTATLTLEECGTALGYKCQSGAVGGVITFESIPFVLVYTAKEPTKTVALAFNHGAGTTTKFNCQSVEGGARGTILMPLTPLNTLSKSFTLKMNTAEGIQTPRENFTESLEGKEASFPEGKFLGSWTTDFGLEDTPITLGELKQFGEPAEGSIEA